MDNVSERAPWMEPRLLRMVTCSSVWPKAIVRTFVPGDHWFSTFKEEAKAQRIKLRTNELSFRVVLEFEFVGIECIEGVWKLVYEIGDRITCTLFDGDQTSPVTGITRRDLIFMAMGDTSTVRLVNTYQLEKIGEVWHFVDEKIK